MQMNLGTNQLGGKGNNSAPDLGGFRRESAVSLTAHNNIEKQYSRAFHHHLLLSVPSNNKLAENNRDHSISWADV